MGCLGESKTWNQWSFNQVSLVVKIDTRKRTTERQEGTCKKKMNGTHILTQEDKVKRIRKKNQHWPNQA